MDPALAEMDPGDVLVAHTTDPSWASLMFMASALVVDIGGQLSHAAVVARELGIPCVMNTGEGTRRLRDGDRIRVDGITGTVEILARNG
jgi:pyruvate,water dikinase